MFVLVHWQVAPEIQNHNDYEPMCFPPWRPRYGFILTHELWIVWILVHVHQHLSNIYDVLDGAVEQRCLSTH